MTINYCAHLSLTKVGGCLALLLALAACSSPDQEELQSWMGEQKANTRPNVVTIPEPKRFTPVPYVQDSSTEPFSSQKLAQALKRESAQATANVSLVAPELNRRKEPLEAFPLDAMALVGSLAPKGQPIALVKVDTLLYQVKVGNYLGQNYGKVLKVSETEVVLREIVQDAGGEWIERQASLQLQERSK